MLIVFYAFEGLVAASDLVCNALETICDRWGIPEDVGGATLLAVGNAIPEITVNVITTIESLSEGADPQDAGDVPPTTLGIGATLGSGLIAFLVIPAACGLVTPPESPVLIKRRPVLRETGFYLASLAVLLYMIMNGATLEGSACLVVIYAVYLFVLLLGTRIKAYFTKQEDDGVSIFRQRTEDAKAALLEDQENGQPSDDDEDEDQGPLGILHDYIAYPVVGPVNASAPDCRIGEPDEDKYGKTFVVSIAWLTFFSYVITVLAQRWVALLHDTANDSAVLRLFGVVLVAFAAQVPDTANSITAAMRGYGSMATSGALGSQVVNTCVGFGLPWVITFLFGKQVVLEPDPGLISQVWLMIGSCTFLLLILVGDAMRLGESKAVMTRQKAAACIVLYLLCICYSARGLF